jgi:hypothetical protein
MVQRIEVTLTKEELYLASMIGSRRRIECMFHGSKAHFETSDEWTGNIEPCCAEIAVSRFLNKYWTGGAFCGPDSKDDVDGKEVRLTKYDSGKLLIYPEDNPDARYVLVTGLAPKYYIRGWILGREAISKGKNHEWWIEPKSKLRESWWVPQKYLRDIPLQSKSPD